MVMLYTYQCNRVYQRSTLIPSYRSHIHTLLTKCQEIEFDLTSTFKENVDKELVGLIYT